MRPLLAWHFLRDDRTLQFAHNGRESVKARVGQTLRHSGALSLCKSGLHASIRLIDALKYAPGATICRVECGGKILRGADKICAETRKVLWMIDGTRLLHEFACDVAEAALLAERKAGRETDKRSWNAIAVKRRWIDGKATDSELAAAWAAAWAAAGAAAGAARAAAGAAWAAAWAAARDAARDAARGAAWAAWGSALGAALDAALGASRAAVWGEQNKLLTRRVLAAHRKAVGQ